MLFAGGQMAALQSFAEDEIWEGKTVYAHTPFVTSVTSIAISKILDPVFGDQNYSDTYIGEYSTQEQITAVIQYTRNGASRGQISLRENPTSRALVGGNNGRGQISAFVSYYRFAQLEDGSTILVEQAICNDSRGCVQGGYRWMPGQIMRYSYGVKTFPATEH
jgi:hypothetical protein